MREAIDGKIYDTADATKVAEWSNSKAAGDFKRVERELYRTKKGAWFEKIDGGALTKWSKPVPGGGSAGDTVLNPLTDEEACSWLEEYGDVDTLDEYFPDYLEKA